MFTYILLAACLLASIANGEHHKGATYYLPGVAPQTYNQRENVKLFVSKLTSTKTQIPYEYYSLPYCRPKKTGLQMENLGEVLSGDRIENSIYQLEVKTPKQCVVACVKKLSKHERTTFVNAIKDNYRVHWMLDNLPVGSFGKIRDSSYFSRGFPVGFSVGTGRAAKNYLYNHVKIRVLYHDDVDSFSESGGATTKIVGFSVTPASVKHTVGDTMPEKLSPTACTASNDPAGWTSISRETDKPIMFTYDVEWFSSTIEWSERWDVYLSMDAPDEKVHWFSITNSIMIVLFLSVMIAVILIRALRKDIAAYNDSTNLEEAKDESGWKLVHGDVFRPPATQPMLFSVLVGSGVQLCCMCMATITFALLGLLSPANRGSLVTAFILLFVFMGSFAGYYSSSIYKMFRGLLWRQNTLMTAFLYPGIVFSIILSLNLILSHLGSSGAIPFTSLFTLLFLWSCVSVPLVFLGSFFGYKREISPFPVRTNQIPRAIPEQQWYMHPVMTCMLSGLLPFGAVSVELYFIMSALWLHQIYYIFGFLFLVMLVLLVTCAEVAILMCYFQLLNEDYRWWWRSFLHSGSCAFYTALYAVWYHLVELDMNGIVPVLLYYGYMSIICFTFFLITGTIGYLSCFWFNLHIYGSIKVD